MKRMMIILTCFLVVLLLVGNGGDIPPKRRISGIGDYPSYNLQEAVDLAKYVVYGKVVSKGRPVEIVERASIVSRPKYRTCYRKVTLEVIDCTKGGLKAGDKVSYCEWGGETQKFIYTEYYTKEVTVDENVFVFLVDAGGKYKLPHVVLTPWWIWILEDTDDLVYFDKDFVGFIPETMVLEVTEREGYRKPRTVKRVPFTALLEATRALAEGTIEKFMGEIDGEPEDKSDGDLAYDAASYQ